MANTINIPKTHIIMGLSLPLAILIGYFLAEPMELGSIAVVVMVFAVLCIPLMMRWYYPMLVFCWNAAITPAFLPGRPALWAVLAFGGLLLCVLNRSVNAKARFLNVPSITKPMLFMTAVVLGTAMLTGGIGVQALGSATYGGKKYFYMFAGVAGYFVLTSRWIPPERAGLYVALFFLSGMTDAIADLAYAFGPQFRCVTAIVSPDYASEQIGVNEAMSIRAPTMVRMGGLGWLGTAAYTYLLARYGIRGLFEKPWRLLLLMLVLCAGLAGGFRSFVAMFGLTFGALFFLDRLHRTRYLPMLAGIALLGGAILLPQANKLPLVAQRSLSFLPGKFDFVALESAKDSTDWRVQMWKQVLPEIPRYLLRGKGYSMDASDFYMTLDNSARFSGDSLTGTIAAGDYHSGPLSIIIPFGIWGVIGFFWFLWAALRLLHRTYKRSNPALIHYNALFLALFAARTFFFFFGFGSFHSDIAFFAGIVGMSIALNGTEESEAEEAERLVAGAELKTEYIKA